ncbi:MAG: alpha-L-fucosidase [Promethearchaeota archaeon]
MKNFQPTLKSVREHELPDWYNDAKLGIFIHWALFSVPAFAPIGKGENLKILAKEGWKAYYAHNPYAEWYINTMKIPDSPTQKYHNETFGEDFSYDNFIPMFNKASEKWNPEKWAELFKKAGAKYVVLVTKHHDGFLLWPSEYPHPKRENYHSKRDIIGELTKAVKSRGMKMGLYYSSGLDNTFIELYIKDPVDEFTQTPNSEEYIDMIEAHWKELIDKYEPSILWNDIAYPRDANVAKLFAYFYNKMPDGVINDRWMQVPKFLSKFANTKIGRKIVCWYVKRLFLTKGMETPNPPHCDFTTQEYSTCPHIVEKKWEATRGLGTSFGLNRAEKPEDYLSVEELVRLFVDIVSKNGNLLLNLGPEADGTIPEIQKTRVLGLGKWLEINGEAIYGTRPWIRAEGKTTNGIRVRFTQKAETLYIFLLDIPKKSTVTIESLVVSKESKIRWLGYDVPIDWKQKEDALNIEVPKNLAKSPVYTISITPKPPA